MSSLNSYNSGVVEMALADDIGILSKLSLEFTKMQGLGNDFVVFSGSDLHQLGGSELIEHWEESASHWAKLLCDQHFGVGADGLIAIFDRQKPETVPTFVNKYPGDALTRFAWTYTNKDGSVSLMCGNGLRCVLLWLHSQGLVEGKIAVATAVGDISMQFNDADDIVCDLGAPRLKRTEIPVNVTPLKNVETSETENFVLQSLRVQVGSESFPLKATCVNMGNPHCVIFDDLRGRNGKNLKHSDIEYLRKVAENIQTSGVFPEGINVEFVWANTDDNLTEKAEQMRVIVFERGCGRTLACASGAAAVLVAGVLEGRAKREAIIHLEGGPLVAEWTEDDEHVLLRGPAKIVYKGLLQTDFISEKGLLSGKVNASEVLEVAR
jgi:diaminopimelate epimerase